MCSSFWHRVERASQRSYSIETVLETDDRTRLGVENTRPDTATKRAKEKEKGSRMKKKRERGREKEGEGGRKKESMGISTKHVTIKGTGGCESSLD